MVQQPEKIIIDIVQISSRALFGILRNMNRRCFALVMVIGIIAAILVVGIIGYFIWKNSASQQQSGGRNGVVQSSCYQEVAKLDYAVTFYFSSKSDFSKIQLVAADLKFQSGVKTVSANSAADLLKLFEQQHANNPVILQAVNQLNANPLESDLDVTVSPDQDLNALIGYVERDAQKYGIAIDTTRYVVTQQTKQTLLNQITDLENSTSAIAVTLLQELCAHVTSTPFSENP